MEVPKSRRDAEASWQAAHYWAQSAGMGQHGLLAPPLLRLLLAATHPLSLPTPLVPVQGLTLRPTEHVPEKAGIVPPGATLEYELSLVRVSIPPS